MKRIVRRIGKHIVPRSLHPFVLRMLARKSPRRRTYGTKSDKILDCCIAYNDFGAYCIPFSSYRRVLTQTVLNGEVWEPETVSFIRDHCGKGDVVHGGAYFGDFLPAVATSLDRNAKLWAFEPSPENFRCASITKLLNNLENVELIQNGLGSCQGPAQIVVKAEGKPLGPAAWIIDEKTSSPAAPDDAEVVAIKVTAIDDVVPNDRHVSIIHLDLEGYELAAIDGAMQTIRRCRPILIIEVFFNDEEWLLTKLKPLGYRRATNFGANLVMESSTNGDPLPR